MKDPVRVKLANGGVTTVEASYAKSKGLTVLDGAGAVGRDGRPLPEEGVVDELTVAAADARAAVMAGAAKPARRRPAKKTAGKPRKRAAAKKTTAPTGAAANKTTSPTGDAGEGNQS